jgi:hypothetical protein
MEPFCEACIERWDDGKGLKNNRNQGCEVLEWNCVLYTTERCSDVHVACSFILGDIVITHLDQPQSLQSSHFAKTRNILDRFKFLYFSTSFDGEEE